MGVVGRRGQGGVEASPPLLACFGVLIDPYEAMLGVAREWLFDRASGGVPPQPDG